MNSGYDLEKSTWGTVVIGAGQAGLAMGFYLSRINEDFVILDSTEKVGDNWRCRWESLRLFTPTQYDSLPGFPFPSKKGAYPTKDEMAGYLAEYADLFNLPVRLKVKAYHITKTTTGFEITTSNGTFTSERVVVATGTNPVPRVPGFAKDLDKSIFQVHSSGYINPESVPLGKTLVVGSGTSGVEIALELSESRSTSISGNPTMHIPDPILRYGGNAYWWLLNNLITVRTPIGRKARQKLISGGSPLIRVSATDLEKAGVERLPRVSGIKDGLPVLDDGRVMEVSSVVWATGYRPDFSWIEPSVTDNTGWPATDRGISTTVDGMYFMGMLFQYGLTSGLIGGVGRDAEYIAGQMKERKARSEVLGLRSEVRGNNF